MYGMAESMMFASGETLESRSGVEAFIEGSEGSGALEEEERGVGRCAGCNGVIDEMTPRRSRLTGSDEKGRKVGLFDGVCEGKGYEIDQHGARAYKRAARAVNGKRRRAQVCLLPVGVYFLFCHRAAIVVTLRH